MSSRNRLLHPAPGIIEPSRFRNRVVAQGHSELTQIVADLPVDLFQAKE